MPAVPVAAEITVRINKGVLQGIFGVRAGGAAGQEEAQQPVLVAVDLVLESGLLSVEHIQNVIARLDQASLPTSVETTLQLKQAPIANTGRYDTLRDAEVDHA